MSIPDPPDASAMTVLISWAHSDAEWGEAEAAKRKQQVLRLAQGLRSNGIDADIDLYHASDAVDWTRWGPARVRDVDIVLVVTSEAWKLAWEGRGDTGKNVGAAAEADTLRSLYAEDRTALISKCRLIVLPGVVPGSGASIPDGMHGVVRHHVSEFDDHGLEELVRDLTGQPADAIPPLGRVKVLPPSMTSLSPTGADLDASGAAASSPGASTLASRAPLQTAGPLPHDAHEEIEQLRQQLQALPDPLPGEDVHLPWYRQRELVMRRLVELGAFDDDPHTGKPLRAESFAGTVQTHGRPETATAENSLDAPHQVDWQSLSTAPEVLWREEWDQHGGYEPAALCVHLIPVDAQPLSQRLFADLADRAPTAIRAHPDVAATDGIRLDQQVDALTVVIERAESSFRGRTIPGHLAGVRLAASRQVSAWRTLPRDHMGSVLDGEDLRAALLTCLTAATHLLDLADGSQVVVATELGNISMLTDGTLASLGNRSSASMSVFGRGDIHAGGDESVDFSTLRDGRAGAVIEVLADLLERKHRR